ncbi:MAG TPA: carbon-nitrogen hydrolase family protein [Longimicrobium sp.]|nr:carbon-nitrogen hydrolase family protein [Longimicrobium sp.]
MSSVRIALANFRYPPTPADSVRLAVQAIEEAAARGAELVCFPECYVPGYRMPGRPLPPPDPAFLEQAWSTVAQAAGRAGIAVILGTERVVDGAPRLTALVVGPDGERLGFQDKVQLDPSEEPFYTPGADRQLFRVGPLTFGIVICHEGWRYPETVRWAAARGAQVVFHPHYHEPEPGSYRPTTFADPANTFHEKAMLCRAAENTCWFASVNCAVDGAPSTSAIARPDGSLHSWQPYGQEGLLLADLDLTEASGLLASRYKPPA